MSKKVPLGTATVGIYTLSVQKSTVPNPSEWRFSPHIRSWWPRLASGVEKSRTRISGLMRPLPCRVMCCGPLVFGSSLYAIHFRKKYPCQNLLNVFIVPKGTEYPREAVLCCSLCLPAPWCWTQCWSRMTEDWRDKDTVGVRTLASFIETAPVQAACNSSEALVLTVAWQSFHSLDRERGKDGLGRRARMKEEHRFTQGHSSNQASHTWKPSEGVLAQSTQSHWGPASTPHHSLHCTHQGSQALGYKWAITMVWVALFSPLCI